MSVNILFVCMGNICRSPALMAFMRRFVKEKGLENKIHVDSCALTDWYVGSDVDDRLIYAAKGMHLDLHHKARLIKDADFSKFGIIVAVDREVLSALRALAHKHNYKGKIILATAYSKKYRRKDMHDPYFGGARDFAKTFEMAEDCTRGLLEEMMNAE